jgi:hypothetical protein
MRGQEGEPIYIPSGRKIVETAHRYLAPGLEVIADPNFGTDTERAAAMQILLDFFRRERLASKFSANKRNGLIRGDWLWHLYADPERTEGSRISIFPLDPAVYFPEFLEGDVDQRIAAHLIEPVNVFENEARPVIPGETSTGKPGIRKLSYIKATGRPGPSQIHVVDAVFDSDAWGQPQSDMDEKLLFIIDEQDLPDEIDQIPVYHTLNTMESGSAWGSSEMRGVERLMSAINQAITDEELTLVLEGLGVYVSTAGAPVDEDGEEEPWTVAPARVLEIPRETDFKRVTGITTMAPFQDHLKYLHQQIDESTGNNDITQGRADVQVAESGIALALRMTPLLSRMDEKDLFVTDSLTNLFFDLRKWFSAFEGISMEAVRFLPRYREKLPVNKAQLFDEVVRMYTAAPVPLISGREARRILTRAGWTFAAEPQLEEEILTELEQAADLGGSRIEQELNAPEPEPEEEEGVEA